MSANAAAIQRTRTRVEDWARVAGGASGRGDDVSFMSGRGRVERLLGPILWPTFAGSCKQLLPLWAGPAAAIRHYHATRAAWWRAEGLVVTYSRSYFPMQNRPKISPSRSSAVNSPVMSPSAA